MTARERKRLLASEGHICITYAVDDRGTLIEQARRHWLSSFYTRVRGAVLALAATVLPFGTACANRQLMGKIAPPPSPTATPTPPPKIAVPGGIELPPPPSPSPTPGR
jgi:hypothetical protein